MRYVLFYESADDVLSKAPAHFRTRAVAEAFVEGDQFVLNGVVRWEIREWNEVLAAEA